MTASQKISVIIPCYNSEKYLRQTIESVLWQTYPNWECILVDDGSTDSSASIFQSYVKIDPRFIYKKQKNQGPSVARNFGVEVATGEFIQFLDADDILLPDRFQDCITVFEKHSDIDIVYSDFVLSQDGQREMISLPAKIPGTDVVKAMLFDLNVGFVVLMHSLFFRYRVVKDHPFDAALPFWAEDQDCWIRMSMDGAKFHYLKNILVIYRFSQNNLTSHETKLIAAKIEMLQRYQTDKRTVRYSQEFLSSLIYLHQRLVIGHFMEKSFQSGIGLMRSIWKKSSMKAIIKMCTWGVLMLVFTKKDVHQMRTWVVKHTPFKLGGWKDAIMWSPPESVKKLMNMN